MRRLSGMALALAFGLPAHAFEIVQTDVSHAKGRYQFAFDVRIDAPIDAVRTLMTDYARLARLSDIVVESSISPPNARGLQRLDMKLRGCVLFYCKTVRKVEDIETGADGEIITRAVPNAGDFHFSEEHWRIVPDAGQRARLRYTGVMEPSFFIPPLIGPPLLKRNMQVELIAMMRRIEQLARTP